MNKYRKVTKEIKESMIEMRKKGFTAAAIGRVLGLSSSTIFYHLDETQRKKSIERSKRNEKPRDRKEYQRNYQANRYKNDTEYRERIKKANRENQNKKYKEKHGTK